MRPISENKLPNSNPASPPINKPLIRPPLENPPLEVVVFVGLFVAVDLLTVESEPESLLRILLFVVPGFVL